MVEEPSDGLSGIPVAIPPIDAADDTAPDATEPAALTDAIVQPSFELPTARKVVSAGLQLALTSSRDLRRASVYVGLLVLGSFGPTLLLVLLGLGRILSVPGLADGFPDSLLGLPNGHLIAQTFALIELLAVVGFVLFVAILIDAQAIAVSILGSNAAGRPMRLFEAILRARQVFLRLLGVTAFVAILTQVASFAITIALTRSGPGNEATALVADLLASLLVTPFVFAPAGVVLGDVPAAEALKRSIRLFRVRPRVALVVTLFTLVTAALETFAFGSGVDAAERVAGLLHLGLTQGAVPLLLSIVAVFAFVVALGSLAFTIAAIVAAPQIAGFLGLTFYSAGLDRARVEGHRPYRFAWVTRPMAITMIVVALLSLLGYPAIAELVP